MGNPFATHALKGRSLAIATFRPEDNDNRPWRKPYLQRRTNEITIHLESLTGHRITDVDIYPDEDNWVDVKTLIENDTGLPYNDIHISWQGKEPPNSQSLADARVPDGATIKYTFTMRTGFGPGRRRTMQSSKAASKSKGRKAKVAHGIKKSGSGLKKGAKKAFSVKRKGGIGSKRTTKGKGKGGKR